MPARRLHTGPILTNAPTLDEVEDAIHRGGYDTLKVVTGWGLPTGWNKEAIQRACRLTPQLIVRTRTGDVSLDGRWGGDWCFVDQTRAEVEVYAWYRERRDLWIELGNEPNLFSPTTRQMHEFAYFLGTAIDRCRRVFPDARLIAPAVKIDEANAEEFLRICAMLMRRCDAIGLHAYEWTTFAGPVAGRKGDLEKAFDLAGQLFEGRDWWLTEFGIHGPELPATTKGARYAELLHRRELPRQLIGATYYHLCCDGKVQPEYHIAPRGDLAYHQQRYGVV